MFCVECGSEKDIHDGLCRNCLMKKGPFVELPKTIDVMVCAHCDAMKIGSQWVEVDDVLKRALTDALMPEKDVEMNWEMDVEEEDERNFKVGVKLDVRTRGFEFPLERETRIRVKVGSCKKCSRKRGSYYEAIVQLRAKKRVPSQFEIDESLKVAEELVSMSGSFITKVDNVKGGTDIYFGKTSDGRALAQQISVRFGGRTTETKSQAGRKDGKDLFRSTYLVRLPSFKKGDLVLLDNSVWEICTFTKNRANLADISIGTRRSFPMKDIESLPILERSVYLKETVVVSETEDEIQVMDPESYRTVEVKRPPAYKEGSKEIKVVPFDGDIYIYLL